MGRVCSSSPRGSKVFIEDVLKGRKARHLDPYVSRTRLTCCEILSFDFLNPKLRCALIAPNGLDLGRKSPTPAKERGDPRQ